jgi:predicted enzyme related to lactoylglutathione lyase
VELSVAGAVIDVAATDLDRAEEFYATLIGRAADLSPRPDQREWHLLRQPEIDLRITASPADAGHGSVSLGVADLAAERARLLAAWPGLGEPEVKPGIIALLRLRDPDGNAVALWQDLMGSRRG